MSDLSVNYLGLKLKNPLIIGASNLVTDLSTLVKLEEAGASAVVYKSLFEEQIQIESYMFDQEIELYQDWDAEHASIFPKLGHAGPVEHLRKLQKAKETLSIPVIGSLNCVYPETWEEYALEMQQTGIDALELNFYTTPTDPLQTGNAIIESQLEVLQRISKKVEIPISVKLSPYYTNPLNVIDLMDGQGVKGFVLFNRLFQPDIDVTTEGFQFPYIFSHSVDNRIALRYAGLLYGNIKASICSNTGILDGADVIKMILAGADAVQLVSAIYKKGISHLPVMLLEISEWMEEKEYNAIDDFRGKLSKAKSSDPFSYKRAQYVDILLKSEIFMKYHPKAGEGYIN